MRWDRFITLNAVAPLRRVGSRLGILNGNSDIPILMYHSVSDEPEPGVGPYYKTNTSPAVFRQHMQFLAENRYQTIPLHTLFPPLPTPHSEFRTSDALRTPHSAFRTRQVAITFDDGFRDFYTEAFPVLKQHGFTATMFLPSSFIQTPRRSFKSKECLTWDEVREMRKAGIHFGSHTVSHPKLVELTWPEIRSEISNSKSELEQRLGEPITAFAYPFAYPQADRQFVARFTSELREVGYACCATTGIGRLKSGDDPYLVKRLPVNSLDDLSLFGAKLEGAYDWLGSAQAVVKRFKRLVHSSRGCAAGAGGDAEAQPGLN